MKLVSVIGAGTMGNGIAHVFALAGYKVHLIDLSATALEKASIAIGKNLERQVSKNIISLEQKNNALKMISCHQSLSLAAESMLVVEAVSEKEEIKLTVFKSLGEICSSDCILASNTSSISITKLSEIVPSPERVIGMHFMNPVPVMKLVEIIQGNKGSKEITKNIVSICEELGKIPVVVNDSPGFIANRILMPMINEAILSLEEGVAGVAEIDEIMRLGMAHPMGPLQLADYIGLDVCFSILKVLEEGLGSKYKPANLLTKLITEGKLGVKSGQGFYLHNKDSKEMLVSPDFKG